MTFLTSPAHGWGLLSPFPPFRYFPHFPSLSKQTLALEYHVYIWLVLLQLSCGDTCQKWMLFKEFNRYFCRIENFANGEINEQSFSNPHSRWCWQTRDICLTKQVAWYQLIFDQFLQRSPTRTAKTTKLVTRWWNYIFCSISECNGVIHVT